MCGCDHLKEENSVSCFKVSKVSDSRAVLCAEVLAHGPYRKLTTSSGIHVSHENDTFVVILK